MITYEQFIAAEEFPPTNEQKAVITSSHQATLVIAGAGSGKTATMANRIAWLLASGQARPGEILGLTFTRKAAGELAQRVNRKIQDISTRGLFEPGVQLFADENDEDESPHLSEPVADLNSRASQIQVTFERPTISTYNAFASNIATSYGMLIGQDPAARLMNEAERFQLMFEIVSAGQLHESIASLSVSSLTTAALDMAAGLIDNDVSIKEARTYLEEEAEAVSTVLEPRLRKGMLEKGSPERAVYDRMSKVFSRTPILKSLATRIQLLDFVSAYFEKKKEDSLIEFADQVSWATRILETVPAVKESLAKQYPVILLDEYQDTSVNQARFLHAAFGQARSVTAVGDPNQAIYGWRGASANAFADFIHDYDVMEDARLSLSQAFRNSTRILAAANQLTQGKLSYENLPICPLRPREQAPAGEVIRIHRHYAGDTYQALAQQLATRLRCGEDGQIPTAAVLIRNHSFAPAVTAALESAGVPFEVIGGQSSIVRPEIRAVRALLNILDNPQRNDQLMYLFNFFALGVQDIRQFSNYANELAKVERAAMLTQISNQSSQTDIELVKNKLSRPEVSLVSALLTHKTVDGISDEGQKRLAYLASILKSLEQERHRGLEYLVSSAIKALDLTIYAASRVKGGAAVQAALSGFVKLAGTYTTQDPSAQLSGFLAWVDAMEIHEHSGEATGAADASLALDVIPSAGIVQILTVNAAKGLEWDIVAIPEMVEKRFDYVKRTYPVWHQNTSVFPSPLRADAKYLPLFSAQNYLDIDDAQIRKVQAILEYGVYDQAVRAYAGDEERRLAYVALTRPKNTLMLLTYDFADEGKAGKAYRDAREVIGEEENTAVSGDWPLYFTNVFISDLDGSLTPDPNYQEPFTILADVVAWGDDQALPIVEEESLVNKLSEANIFWPTDVDRSVEPHAGGYPVEVREIAPIIASWTESFEHIRSQQLRKQHVASVKRDHLTASDVVSLISDAQQFYRDQRRPIPQPASVASRRGISVHAAIAQRFNSPLTLDVDSVLNPDQMPIDIDINLTDEDIELYVKRFESSRFVNMAPLAIEQALEIFIAGFPVRCVIDAVLDTSSISEVKPVTIVDWKTGVRPAASEIHSRELQLGLYRLAWSKAHNVPLAEIDACFYYLGESDPARREIHAGDLTEAEIEKTICDALANGATNALSSTD
ncbi:ATP-dependent helicase [Arcanobacterium buesumense]|nr:ATP-dependent helicase [Arcanobacterium buesumense]